MKKNKNLIKLNKRLLVLGLGVAGLIIGLTIYFKTRPIPPQVAEVGGGDTCAINLRGLTMENICGNNSFKKATATCRIPGNVTSNDIDLLAKGECLNYNKIYRKAREACGETCTQAPPASPRPSTTKPLPSGCTYSKVQCIQAPCDPVVICNPTVSPLPSPSPFPSYNPYPSATCKPRPACLDAVNPCKISDRDGAYCATLETTSQPSFSAIIYPNPSDIVVPTRKLSNCINFFGRHICWPGIRPQLD